MTHQLSTDVAIVGAGPAGLCAVTACGHLGMSCVVVDALSDVGGQCAALYPEKPIYDVPGFPEVTAGELVERLQRQASAFQPTYILKEHVTGLSKTRCGLTLATSAYRQIQCSAVIVAAGAGAFGPNRPPLEGIEQFEGKQVHYWVRQQALFANARVVVAGGGDSAVDWAISLSAVASDVSIVHRRDKFRAAPASIKTLQELISAGKIQLKVPYQISRLVPSGSRLGAIEIADLDGKIEIIPADHLLAFFGLSSDLSALRQMGLSITEDVIPVDPASMATNIAGVFAIGDVAGYANKRKLIVTGFAEAFTAARMAYAHVHPGRAFHFAHSTDRGSPTPPTLKQEVL